MNFQDLISPAWTETIGYAIIHTLWIGCVIGLIAFLMLRFKKNSSPQVKYAISAFSMFAIFGTFILAIGILWPADQQMAKLESVESVQKEVVLAKTASLQQEKEVGIFDPGKLESVFPYIVLLWFLGSIFLFIRTLIGWIWVVNVKNRHTYGMPLHWERKFVRWKQQTGISRKVKLVESKLATIPMTIGYFRPFVILPAGATAALSVDELKMVVLHELAHIKRHDYLINVFQSIIESILFYHPVVWWLSLEVKKEREHISDDLAVKWGGSPKKLAVALTKISESNYKSPQLALALASKKPHLLNRVKRLLTNQEISSQSPEKLTIMIIVILLTALLSTSAINYSGNQQQGEEATSMLSSFSSPNLEVKTTEFVSSQNTKTSQNEHDPPDGKVKVVREFEEGPYDKAKIVMNDGEIQKLKVDGKRIDEEDYKYYEDLINELVPGYHDEHHVFFVKPKGNMNWNHGRNFEVRVPDVPKPPHFKSGNHFFHHIPKPPSPPHPPRFHAAPNHNFNYNYKVWRPDSSDEDTIVIKYDSAGVKKEMSFAIPHFDFDFEFDEEEMERYTAEWEEHMEHWGEANGERMKAYQEMMEKYQEHMQEFQERMEEWQERYQEEIEEKMERVEKEMEKQHEMRMELNEKKMDKIGEKLHDMGLIEESDEYQLELKNGTMKVNGEEQEEATYEKFKNWYEAEFDTKITDKMNIELNVN